SPRFVHGPLEVPGGSVPAFPLAVVTRVGRRETRRVAAAVVGPIAAAAGKRLAIRRESESTNPIAMPWQRPSQTTGDHIPQPNGFVADGCKVRDIGPEDRGRVQVGVG